MSLVFEIAPGGPAAARERVDIACFIGFVGRRPAQGLPAAVEAQFRAAGWLGGPWARPARQLQALLDLPVACDSFAAFDALYAWDRRPVDEAGTRRCCTWLGAAVRSFFARGGRRAIVIRVDDPWPYLESGENRARERRQRIRRMLPEFAERGEVAHPFTPHDPGHWRGIHHLAGLREPSLVLLPDLPDACTYEPPVPRTEVSAPALPEGFVECSEGESEAPADTGLRRLPAPRLDSRGFAAWLLAMRAATAFLADPRSRREALLVAALPLPDLQARRGRVDTRVHALADLPGYLRRVGVLRPEGAEAGPAASAFVQLGWPWLQSAAAAADLPEGLEPPDGTLAGLIAASALARGTFRSVAGEFSRPRLSDIAGTEPVPSRGGIDADGSGATELLARHLCVFGRDPRGISLLSDVTTSPVEAWRFGGASRLVAAVLRAARAAGESVAFEANGPVLWARLRGAVEDQLMAFWRGGAFAGETPATSFAVRCDRSTMSAADLDQGRLVVEIVLRPAAAVEKITVRLALGNTELQGAALGAPA